MCTQTTAAQHTIFDSSLVPKAPEDPHYGLRAAYNEDPASNKVDLVIGAYRDSYGKPWMLPAVRKADEIYHNDLNRNNEYLSISGIPDFTAAAQKLILGVGSPAIQENRVCSFQTISGTGALRLGASFLSKFLPRPTQVYLSTPTYDNHSRIFSHEYIPLKLYPYLAENRQGFDLEGMVAVLEQAPGGSIILLQACAHNPTGFDPTKSQWKKIAEVIRVRNLLPFFDCAYQGFASGSLERDSFPVRHFIDRGIELVIAQSFAKNLGLYGQRVGCFHYVAPSGAHEVVSRVKSQLAVLQRSQISSPPIYGARVASIVLNDEELFAQWQEDLQTMSSRIVEMRDMLRRELERLQTPGDWSHITGQIGMFSFTGLSEAQVVELRSKWQVYMLTDGRMSMSGLNLGNVKYVAEAVDDVVRRL